LRGNAFFQSGLMLVLLASSFHLCADWQPWQARYEVYRNGKLTGQLDIAFEQQGERWNMKSEGIGLRGMARFLRAKESEFAEGVFAAGRFRPVSYTHQRRVATNDDLWTVKFDWQSGTVDIAEGSHVRKLEVDPDTVDPLTLKLEVQRGLRDKTPAMSFREVDDGKIKDMVYRVQEPETIDTPLGCLKTIPVERIKLGGTRFSRSWHASDMDFILVRLEHGKSNGDDIELRITELRFGQKQISPGPACDTL